MTPLPNPLEEGYFFFFRAIFHGTAIALLVMRNESFSNKRSHASAAEVEEHVRKKICSFSVVMYRVLSPTAVNPKP